MFSCKIKIIAFLYNKHNRSLDLISTTNNSYCPLEISVSHVENLSFYDYALNIIDEYISVDIKKISLKLLDAVKEDSNITIYYVCLLPIGSRLVRSYNISHHTLTTHPLIKKALNYV